MSRSDADPDAVTGPLILAFDTSAARCAAALVSGGRMLAAREEAMERGQAERLLPMLEEMLAGAGRGWADLDAIAVCVGPGNFTGVRIGVAAARGLAMALDRPAIGVDRFEALAEGRPGRVRIALDAGRGSVYAQDFRDGVAEGPAAPDVGPADPGPGLADPAALARIAAARLAAGAPLPPPAPLYLRPADAAPAREPAPVLLDGP